MNTASALSQEPHLKTTRVRLANILVAVDLSASSATTLKIAADLAYQHGSRLVVAHVKLPSEAAVDIEATIRLWMNPYLKNDARYSIEVAQGDVSQEISTLVKKHCADLLIIGTHAATDVERLVLGSTAEALFRNINVPVLTIGPQVRSRGAGFSSILLPTDLEPRSLRAAQYAVSLAEESNGTLTLLHVSEKPDTDELQESLALEMQQLVPEDAGLWCKPVFKTESGDLTEAILSNAERTRADLIVLAVSHARILADHARWSVASKVVRGATCPVLTVRNRL